MVATSYPCSAAHLLPPSSPPLPPAPPGPAQLGVAVLDSWHLGLAPVWGGHPRDVGEDLCHVSDGLGPALPEDHSAPRPEVLWVLDEAEEAGGLVTRSEVFPVHGHY